MKLRTKINIVLLVVVVIPFFGAITVNLFREPRLIRFSNANMKRFGKDGVRKSVSASGPKVDLTILQKAAKFLGEVGGAEAVFEAIKRVQAVQVK